jgi:polar amino acid transport system substrate-binding protein
VLQLCELLVAMRFPRYNHNDAGGFMKLKRLLALGVVILFAVTCAVATADEYLFVTFEYPPLEFEGEQGWAQGIAVEIVRKVMHNLDYGLQINVFPWTRALDMVRTGRADAIFTAYKNSAREQFLNYPDEILFRQEVYFYRKKGSQVEFDGNLTSLHDKTIRGGFDHQLRSHV